MFNYSPTELSRSYLSGALAICLAILLGIWFLLSDCGDVEAEKRQSYCPLARFDFAGRDASCKLDDYPFSAQGVTISYYDISGSELEELQREIKLKGPIDSEGINRDAYVSWKIDWHWPSDPRPNYSELRVDYQINVLLPRWTPTGKVDDSVRKSWQWYYHNMLRHEARHISHVLENVVSISEEIEAAVLKNPKLSHAAANKIANGIVKRIQALDLDYDRVTMHGKVEGVILQ